MSFHRFEKVKYITTNELLQVLAWFIYQFLADRDGGADGASSIVYRIFLHFRLFSFCWRLTTDAEKAFSLLSLDS